MLKRVSIQNFKSLKDVTLDLQKVNLLIGPNNSGKTNFLKALEYVSPQSRIRNTENANRVFYNKSEGLPFFRLEVKFETGYSEKLYDFYTLEISGDEGEDFVEFWGTTDKGIEKSEMWDIDKLYENFIEFDLNVNDPFNSYYSYRKKHPNLTIEASKFHIQKTNGKIRIEEVCQKGDLFRLFSSHLNKFSHKKSKENSYQPFSNIRIYKINPSATLKPGVVGIGEEIVDAENSNIVGFLDLMLGKYRKSVFNSIEADLNECIPEFDEVNLEDTQPSEEFKKQFGDKSFKRIGLTNSKLEKTYWADEISEGTLYFLVLLCIINQPNPPQLLLLEEPEKGIHPRRIREVMDFIFRLAEEKDVQIILTTHNEHVLDEFATRPEAVFVFDKDEEGATYVKNLQHDIIEPTNERNLELGLDPVDLTSNLSENWLYGLLGGVPAIP